MKSWKVVTIVVGVLMLARAGLADAGPQPAGPRVLRVVDAATGAVIRAEAAGPDHVSLEVQTESLVLRRERRGQRSALLLRTPSERLELRVDRGQLAVFDGRRTVRLSPGRTDPDTARVRLWYRRSPAVHRAIELLDRIESMGGSPVEHVLDVTRVILRSLSGDPIPHTELSAPSLARVRSGRPALLPIGWQDSQGPGDCWDAYVEEAIEAWMEYEDCVDNEEWWDGLGLSSCLLIYDMRAVGAFYWWLACNSIRG